MTNLAHKNNKKKHIFLYFHVQKHICSSKIFLIEKESKVALNSNVCFHNKVDCQEEQAKSSSHKNGKIKSYTLSNTLTANSKACHQFSSKTSSIGAAERKFGVDRERIRE